MEARNVKESSIEKGRAAKAFAKEISAAMGSRAD